MRPVIVLGFIISGLITGCRNAPVMPPTVAEPTAQALPPSRPLLVTTPGTHTSSDGQWRIRVSENSLDMSHATWHDTGKGFSHSGWTTTSPQGWNAQPGWFVFVESVGRVWAYDGDRKLLLKTHTSTGNHSTGTIYSSGFPGEVPPEVLSRLSEPTKQRVTNRN